MSSEARGPGPAQGAPVHLTQPRPRLKGNAAIGFLALANLVWMALMGQFGSGSVYRTMGLCALAVSASLSLTHGPSLRRLLRLTATDVGVGLVAGVAMTLLTYPAYGVAVGWFPELEPHVAELYATSRQQSLTVATGWVLVIATTEELLWRGAWLESLLPRLGVGAAAASSVALYAVGQLGSGSWIVGGLALACGAVWTALRLWRGSLWPGLLAHLVWTPTVILFVPLR